MKIIQCLLLTLLLLSVTTACQSTVKEFQPKKDSLFKITFSYPASWIWQEDIPFDEPPPNVDLPPSERIVLQNGSLEDGSLSIQVYYESSASLAKMREQMDRYPGDSAFTLRADTTLQIDGYYARWFTLSSMAYLGQDTLPTQDEVIKLFTEDRYYEITLFILESEKDGIIHKQLEELIKSIKILP